MPPHSTYVEACMGSAEVFLRKKPVEKEIINDYNGDLVRFFRVLQRNENLVKLNGARLPRQGLQHQSPDRHDPILLCKDGAATALGGGGHSQCGFVTDAGEVRLSARGSDPSGQDGE